MLLGEYEHTIDDKGRLTLPAKFRQAMAAGIVVTRGLDSCLYAYSHEEWERLVHTSLGDLDSLTREGRQLKRFFFASASEAEPDKQGRVVIPAPLAQSARLAREVVVAGVYDHLEIWDRDAWRQQMREVEGNAEHVAERLAGKHD
jgi:MraZ protein